MAEENIITWNPTNWITITLMVAISFALVGWGQKVWAKRNG